MKKLLVFSVITTMIFLSCRSQKIDPTAICGTFYRMEKDNNFAKSYTLELNQDRSFKLLIKQLDASPQCHGQWEVANNEILLKCQEGENPYETMTNGYMSDREHKLTILNNNKLKYKGVLLRRKR